MLRHHDVERSTMNDSLRAPRVRALVIPIALALALAACATTPAPTAQMAVSQKAIDDAVASDASQYAPAALKRAEDGLDAARVALDNYDYERAQRLAEEAQADADLASTRARSVKAQHAAVEVRSSIRALHDEIARTR
jgi:outer membrane PBP1 activator LpoA protein